MGRETCLSLPFPPLFSSLFLGTFFTSLLLASFYIFDFFSSYLFFCQFILLTFFGGGGGVSQFPYLSFCSSSYFFPLFLSFFITSSSTPPPSILLCLVHLLSLSPPLYPFLPTSQFPLIPLLSSLLFLPLPIFVWVRTDRDTERDRQQEA